MPTIDASYKDLKKLAGNVEPIDEVLMYAKSELDGKDGDSLKIDVKDTNRPDLWSIEGIAREIKLRTKKGLPKFKTFKSNVRVIVDKKVSSVRPFTTCAIVKGLNLNEEALLQSIQLQEKISQTFGRNRNEVAIGIYDLDKIKLPIKYTTVKPNGIKFVPLEFDEEMTPEEILKEHPKGKEYAHLLEGKKEYPMFIDSDDHVLSIPPIINSNYTGKVTTKTKNVFIECSGFNLKFLEPAINVLVCALSDRGGKIGTVSVEYGSKKILSPNLTPKKFSLNAEYVNKISGLDLTNKKIVDLLASSGYDAKISGKRLDVSYPAYRQDIMHPRDVVEDVIISYGYNSVEPSKSIIETRGSLETETHFYESISEILIGLGLQEIMSYTLTSKDNIFNKMQYSGEATEISNPMSTNWSVFRTWLLPGILDFFSRNKHVEYPQNIFEIGSCINLDNTQDTMTKDNTKLCVALSGSVGYDDVSSILNSLFDQLGKKYTLRPIDHPTFIKGRAASIHVGKEIGFVGEIHPQVLNNWKLEKPVSILEIDLDAIMKSTSSSN